MRSFALAVIVASASSSVPAFAAPDPERAPSARIVDAAMSSREAYAKLSWLTDRIGHRLSGSVQLERAVAWAQSELRHDGLDRVWTESVRVPRWIRGVEKGRIVAPVEHEIVLLALGMSEPTPESGLEADVVAVSSFDELRALGDHVKGKIVLFDKRIERNGGEERGYGAGARLRHHGAVEAAKLGAVGMLIRSLGTADFRLPHTGSMDYEDGVPRIPAAAITGEDADLIARLLSVGERVRVSYTLSCRNAGEADSANVLADLRGREKPEEIVVIGAHLDSWDVGTGAIDDGAGVAVVLETMRLLKSLGAVPRRTIRAVLFTNEENGLRGGRDYAARHAEDLPRHVAAIEIDAGGGRPLGFGVTAGPGAIETVRTLAAPLAGISADEITEGGVGADISPMMPAGVPMLLVRQDTTYYFDYHHSKADTLDKVDPRDLAMNAAALATMAYGLADMEGALARTEPPADKSE